MRLRKKNLLRNFVFFDPRSLIKLQNECDYWKAKAEGEKLAREAVQEEVSDLRAKFKVVKESLLKINDIRNSIVGFQTINWSEHIYPLVAALNEAGIKGLHYPEAKKNNGTLKERVNSLESQILALRMVLGKIKLSVLKAYREKSISDTYYDLILFGHINPVLVIAIEEPNICATCSQDCKFDIIDPTECKAYRQEVAKC